MDLSERKYFMVSSRGIDILTITTMQGHDPSKGICNFRYTVSDIDGNLYPSESGKFKSSSSSSLPVISVGKIVGYMFNITKDNIRPPHYQSSIFSSIFATEEEALSNKPQSPDEVKIIIEGIADFLQVPVNFRCF